MQLDMLNSKKGYAFIYALSCFFIIALAIVNGGYANDDHFTVIELISRFGILPKSTQCWQCYHPKLYHLLVAQIWNIFDITNPFYQHRSAQMVSALISCGTVYLFLRFIRPLPFPELLKLFVFAFFALNPRFIAISGQATNDSMVIFLGTLNIYAVARLFHTPSLKYSLLVILSLVLGSMAKLNFGVYLIATIIAMIVLAFLHRNFRFSLRTGYIGTAVIGLLFSTLTFLSFNGYIRDYRDNGKLFTYNTPTHKFPHLYRLQEDYIPGIRSIYSGFFKFHYFDLIRNPHLTYNPELRFKHVHSHFSQLYGRYYFLGFDNWPHQWRADKPILNAVGRVSLAIGIFPTALLFIGLFITLRNTFKGWDFWRKDKSWLYLLYIAGFLGFSVLFSLIGRTFVFMKAIYIFPGLLATIVPFLLGNAAVIKRKAVVPVLIGFYLFLFVLYLTPVVYLILQLADRMG